MDPIAPINVANVALAAKGTTLSPLTLFLEADIVVKLVMLGLLLASIWTWAIIIGHWQKMRRLSRGSERFEREFWKADDVDGFAERNKGSDMPAAKVFAAGLHEWRRSTNRSPIDREGTRARLTTRMGAAIDAEIDRLGDRLNILATVGSVAPFVGLFGTVWGIMRAFTAIAAEKNTALAVVAPGIAEALFATAIGLFAAIPAVIAYNRFGHGLNRMEARLNRFADGFHATLSRELELDR
jgi:biopolymer transport protein TolQ